MSIFALNQISIGIGTVGTASEFIYRGDGAIRRHLVDRTEGIRAALIGGAIEIAIGTLGQAGLRISAIAPAGKRMKKRHDAPGSHLENCAVTIGAAGIRWSKKISICSPAQAGLRIPPIGAHNKSFESRQPAGKRHSENRAI